MTGTVLETDFAPDRLLYANGYDGALYCDWVTLEAGASGSKVYLGQQFIGSGDSTLSGGTNPDGIEVALGSGGHAAGSGFEIYVPYDAMGQGVGPLSEIKLFAAVVKPWGDITSQTLPQSNDWPGYTPNFNAIAGVQAVTVAEQALPAGDIDADGIVDATDTTLFVSVLLGIDQDPDRVARSDLSDDGRADGLDVQPFIQALLGN